MPYKEPEKRRAYDRERKRAKRAGGGPASPIRLLPELRIRVVEDVTSLLEEAVDLIRHDLEARDLDRGRGLLSACGVALKVVEAGNLVARLEEIETVLNRRVVDAKGGLF